LERRLNKHSGLPAAGSVMPCDGCGCSTFPRIDHKGEKMQNLFPHFKTDSVNVLLCADAVYFPAASVTIQSIINHSSPDRNYDIIILASQASDHDVEYINEMTVGRDNFSIRVYDPSPVVSQYDMSDWFFGKRFSPSVYYRLFAPVILKDYSKIVYLDSDLIVEHDVGELFDTDVEGYWLAAVPEFTFKYLREWAASEDWMAEVIEYCDTVLMLEDEKNYFNSGVLVYNLEKMRDDNAFSQFIAFAPKNYKFNHDQNVLNATAQGKVLILDRTWNVNAGIINSVRYERFASTQEFQDIVKAAKIMHFASSHKPWKSAKIAKAHKWWMAARSSPYYERLIFNAVPNPKKHVPRRHRFYSYIKKAYMYIWRHVFLFFCPNNA
jgi:Lipopolysaccharide biosynthesis proteins, LPS:glycosyltransferases